VIRFGLNRSAPQVAGDTSHSPRLLNQHSTNDGYSRAAGRSEPFPFVELLIATRSTHRILGAPRLGIARIAKETGLTWQTVYRIKEDPAGSETALAAWEL
jgi:hypothetical protein